MANEIEGSQDAVTHFSDTAEHYAGKHYDDAARSFMTVRQERVLEFVDSLGLAVGASVLDAGCGPGYLVEQMAARGLRVSAMDGAAGMLRKARERMDATEHQFPVDFRQGDIEKLPYPDASFDLVLSTGVIEYLEGDVIVLSEMNRVLRPDGHLVLSVTNRWSPALWLDGAVEALKCQAWFRKPFNTLMATLGRRPVLPRHFRVRQHSPSRFRAELSSAGFDLTEDIYFHFLPWPRPLDQFFPRVSAALGARMEPLGRTFLGPAAEGYLTLSAKRAPRPSAPRG